ncbi:MAG: Fmu (Sun) domain-containing protein, partial [Niastella sp.]|uniref:Fmu (Sun) domain-containing protein n=1 Tax=Niastella sp. TaxID=1869183 RepID=UPI003899C9F0
LFLSSQEPNELLQHLRPDWNEKTQLPLAEKAQLVAIALNELFPWRAALSEAIAYEPFCASFLTQPDLFLRLRPGKEAVVKNKLQQAGIAFREIDASCLALPNASKIDTVIETDREAVIQDYSSQRIGELMEFIRDASDSAIATADKSTTLSVPRVWDACAASGGKSILANDLFPRIDLTVSDVRKSILINLEKRFATAGIKHYHSFIADLSTSPLLRQGFGGQAFDIIITDVPCSGSGTWSRTPEQLYYFDPQQIERYSALQKKIVQQAIPHLKPGGFLLYCTCSVFKKENEEVVQYIQEQHSLQLLKKELLTGYTQKADTLFGAVFQKK